LRAKFPSILRAPLQSVVVQKAYSIAPLTSFSALLTSVIYAGASWDMVLVTVVGEALRPL